MLIKQYFILFMVYSIFGWICEVICTYRKQGFVNRGFLVGPYCPLYGYSAIVMILTLSSFKNPIILFIMSFIICSGLEYITSFIMERMFRARWWDYSNKPFNVNGRICLRNSLFFGIMGLLLIKLINPVISSSIFGLEQTITDILFYLLLVIYIADNIISFKVVFKIKETARFMMKDNTKEMTQKVKEILNLTFFGKRLVNAFPNINIVFKDIEKKIRGIR